MSAVLLSRNQFERRTVKQLQEELGERGLSTRGKKSILVDRLLESVSRGGPTVSAINSSISKTANVRSSPFSTTSLSKAEVASESISTHSPSPVAAGSAPPSLQTNPDPTKITAAPGLVVDKKETEMLAEKAEEVPGGTIQMPTSIFLPELAAEEQQAELMIPTPPDQFQNPPDHGAYSREFVMFAQLLTSEIFR